MNAKARLIDFLKSARAAPDKPYTFTLDMPPENAKMYIHRMRVELTRFRAALKEQGARIKPFKMLVQEVLQDSLEPNRTHVTMLYQTNGKMSRLQRDISDVFELVATNERQIPVEVRNVKAS